MKQIHGFDQFITRAVQSVSIPGFGHLMAAATFIGEGLLLFYAALIAALIALFLKSYNVMAAFLLTEALMLVYNASKQLFNRQRPDTEYALSLSSTSFPSGHAADSVAFYGLLGFIMYTKLPKPYNYTGLLVGILLPFLIGLSRIYLGAHYPSDVLAGWIIGSLGLLLVIFLFKLN